MVDRLSEIRIFFIAAINAFESVDIQEDEAFRLAYDLTMKFYSSRLEFKSSWLKFVDEIQKPIKELKN